MKRRDFLRGSAAALMLAGCPWETRAAYAATSSSTTAPADAAIARLRIYPALGICRVGGSREWFLGPEVPGLPPRPEGGFKDRDGRIKRQAQRFRIYAFDDQNRVIGEITEGQAEIAWSAHLANTKAAWYGFSNPLDNGDAAPGLPGQRRNPAFVTREMREKMLVIDGGERTVKGRSANSAGGAAESLFEGTFWAKDKVALGHLQTDDKGRLIVVPAGGVSHSPVGASITSFADNDGWHDDWADGPVDATVTLADGRTLQAEGAWVACVGPDFAPEIHSISTLHDVIEDLNISQGWTVPATGPLSFRRHIYPTFRRVALMNWITTEAHLRQGWMDAGDFDDPDFLLKLSDPRPANKAFRQKVLSHFRNPYNLSDDAFRQERLRIPYMLGDGINYNGSPLQWFQFPKTQYDRLCQWAEGNFINDLNDQKANAVSKLSDVPVGAQPQALTEAALEACSGGAFHPGVELTYCLRLAPLYSRHHDPTTEPFRIARGQRRSLIQDVGRLLTPELATEGRNEDGPPIGPQMPGDLTRWMGLPWQCDAFSCQQVVLQEDFPTAVWWPALLPIDVMPEAYYDNLMRTDLSAEERAKFLNGRVPWSRDVAGIGYHANASYWDGITNMIALWERMGFVVRRPPPRDAGRPEGTPSEIYVETGRARSMERRYEWVPEDGTLPG